MARKIDKSNSLFNYVGKCKKYFLKNPQFIKKVTRGMLLQTIPLKENLIYTASSLPTKKLIKWLPILFVKQGSLRKKKSPF